VPKIKFLLLKRIVVIGNVGIGTTTPLNKFTVVDGNSNIGGNYDSPFYLSFSRSSSGGSPAATYFSFENFILSGTDSFGNSIGKQIYTTISATGPSTVYRNIISRVHTTKCRSCKQYSAICRTLGGERNRHGYKLVRYSNRAGRRRRLSKHKHYHNKHIRTLPRNFNSRCSNKRTVCDISRRY
jgi:hypothetical protein